MSFPQFSTGSPVIRMNATTRLLHIPIVQSMTFAQEVFASDFFATVGHFLAVKHFNDRNPEVLSDLPAALQGCDIKLTTEIYDSRYDLQLVSSTISSLLQRENNTLDFPVPAAIVGGGYSSEAKPAAILTGIYGVPLLSARATSSELENRDIYPMFARVVPDDAGNVVLLIDLFRNLGVKKFGVLFPKDEFGMSYYLSLRREATSHGMQVESASFELLDRGLKPGSVQAALVDLRSTGCNYFFGIPLFSGVEEEILRAAYRVGIAGPGFAWYFQEFHSDEFVVDHDDRELIDSLNGVGALVFDPDVSPSLRESLMKFQFNTVLQNEFLSLVKNMNNQIFLKFNLTQENPIYSYWTALAYDAVLLPAYAACSIDKEFFSRQDLFDHLSNITFQGSTGKIRLSKETQTRDPNSITTHLLNIFIDDNSTSDGIARFQTRKIDVTENYDEFSAQHDDYRVFRYSDNTTTPPLPLPIAEVNMNLISDASRITGLSLCGIVVVVAIVWIMFTFFHRRAKYIRASQPPFLYMLCVGVIVMAMSIIPMSFQEPIPTSVLNSACMSQLWLLSIGFTTTFSALFCKIWRLNKLLTSSNRFRRVKVNVKDVLYPFLILLTLNILLLTVWTVVDPLVWVRLDVETTFQSETTSSTGVCMSSSKESQIIFYSLFTLLILTALGCANWQIFKARKLHSEFNENTNVALSMILMTEATVLGLPVLFLVAKDPSAFFLVRSVLIAMIGIAVLMPIFVPKISLRNKKELDRRRVISSHHGLEGHRRSSNQSLYSSDDESSDLESHFFRVRMLQSASRFVPARRFSQK